MTDFRYNYNGGKRKLKMDSSQRSLELVAMAEHIWEDFERSVTTIQNQFELQFYEDAGEVTIFFSVIIVSIVVMLIITELGYYQLDQNSIKQKMKIQNESYELSHRNRKIKKNRNQFDDSDSGSDDIGEVRENPRDSKSKVTQLSKSKKTVDPKEKMMAFIDSFFSWRIE